MNNLHTWLKVTQTNSTHISSLTHHQYEHYLWFHWVE